MSGPTSGPWHSESWSVNESLIYAVVGGRKVHVTLTCVNEDAPLISAAPDLLAALEDIIPSKLCGESWNLPDAETVQIVVTFGELKAARAAIAKATGAA